ncbi:metallophosphoesterase [Schnuerera sp. xch1]|uniref:metallophosphoesterase n=1 Tax=Schnuerera sp. xch1 TaxID=2874283 RepID=UPI001CBDA073|nr:metallophosphoesterase [Schnuerera sp. xch1]MBZ2174561.1 metallophosphoesterase [Schnuerera sp. xch1]
MIYGIGDLHLDYSKKKPMGIFGEEWIDHENKIFDNWNKTITNEDLVLIPGDISWAIKLKDAYHDLLRIDELPGHKIITKGNHDYWWRGPRKLNDLNLKNIKFIQNNSFIYNDKIGIGGTRGWMSRDSEGFDSHDEKVYNREINRLELSLSSLGEVQTKIIMLHYPPFNIDLSPNEFVNVMAKHKVDICIYGHLHAKGHRFVVEDTINEIKFYCVSSDYIDFKPRKIL